MGDKAAARKTWQEALKRHPGTKPLEERLARAGAVNRRAGWLVLAAAAAAARSHRLRPRSSPPDPESFASLDRVRPACAGRERRGRQRLVHLGAAGRDATTLSIRGPLGAGAMQVTTDGQSLIVTDDEGRHLDTEQAGALLRDAWATDLPLAELRYWMLGVPAPGSPSSVADAAVAPVRVIEQSGWRIGYDTFTAGRRRLAA